MNIKGLIAGGIVAGAPYTTSPQRSSTGRHREQRCCSGIGAQRTTQIRSHGSVLLNSFGMSSRKKAPDAAATAQGAEE